MQCLIFLQTEDTLFAIILSLRHYKVLFVPWRKLTYPTLYLLTCVLRSFFFSDVFALLVRIFFTPSDFCASANYKKNTMTFNMWTFILILYDCKKLLFHTSNYLFTLHFA